MTGEDMANCEKPDKLTIVSYLSQFHDIFKKQRPPSGKFLFTVNYLFSLLNILADNIVRIDFFFKNFSYLIR